MKKIFFVLFIAMILCMPVSSIAADDETDMAKISCKEFLESGDNMGMMLTWIDGFMSAKSNNTVISEAWMKKLGTHMGQYCRKNPDHTIMQAMEAVPAE